MTVHEKLSKVQATLSVPKKQFNRFGNFYFRSCEDILEKIKPLEKEIGFTVLLVDEIQKVEDRFYIKATATFTDTETGESVSTQAFAREAEMKKGMDVSQVTGAASSYARKYALSGLLLLDDNKDIDDGGQQQPPNGKKPIKQELKQETKQEQGPKEVRPEEASLPFGGDNGTFDQAGFIKVVKDMVDTAGIEETDVKKFLKSIGLRSFRQIEDNASATKVLDDFGRWIEEEKGLR